MLKSIKVLDGNVRALLSYVPGLITQTTSLGDRMSELDQSVEGLQQAVRDLADRIGDTPQRLADALLRIGGLNTQTADLQADDEADAAQIESLTGERDQAMVDARDNALAIQEATNQIRGIGTSQPEP